MYNVSDAYLETISQHVRTFKIRAEFSYQNASQAVFDDDTIIGEVKIESQAVSGSTSCGVIDIGAVTSATASLTVIDNDSSLKKYSGASFTMCVSLLLENGEYEDVPMGKFFCDTSKMSRDGNKIDVFSYDAMPSFNYSLSDTRRKFLTGKTAWTAIMILVASAKCEFDQDISGFPNSDLILDFSSTQVETGWDGIMWIAQLMGCFARINRQNHLEFVPIKSTWEYFDDDHTSGRIVPVKTIQSSERYNTTFSDDRMHIVGISMPDDNNKLITRGGGGSESDSNVVITLEKNPLIKSFYSLEDILDNILTQIRTVYFYAFRTEIISDPALDAGDTVRLQGGRINGTNDNNDLVGFITHNIWRYRGRHELINTGQTPDTLTDESRDILNCGQPKPQSEKLINAISGKTNETAKNVENITYAINKGVDRAKYLQTDDGYPYAATALRTTHPQSYSGTGGEIGYEFTEKTNNDYSTDWNAMISGKMKYRKATEKLTTHPIDEIVYDFNIHPAKEINGVIPDGINFHVRGYSEGVAFLASAELSCDGLWVSDGLPGIVPYDKIRIFSARYIHSYTEHIQEFVIANVIFNVKDDGIYITQLPTSFGFGGKEAVIPWRSSGDTSEAEQSAQSEAQKAQTMSVKSAASGSEPSYTYDDDGIHISYNGHTKVIPWDT